MIAKTAMAAATAALLLGWGATASAAPTIEDITTLASPTPITDSVDVTYDVSLDLLDASNPPGFTIFAGGTLGNAGTSTVDDLVITEPALPFAIELAGSLLDVRISDDLIELLYGLTTDTLGFGDLALATLDFDPNSFTAQNALDPTGALATTGAFADLTVEAAAVPLPSALALLLPGLIGLAVARRRMR
jgi:hypothetical protein